MGFKMTHISEVPMVAMDQGWEEVGGRRRQRLPKAPAPPPRKETGPSTAFNPPLPLLGARALRRGLSRPCSVPPMSLSRPPRTGL